MRTMIASTLGVLTRTLLPAWPGLPPVDRAGVEEDVVAYVRRQVRRMPTFLRVPFLCAVVVFGLGAVVMHGRPFTSLPVTKRRAYVNAWALSPIIPLRDFVKMIRSCALLAWFDHARVAAALQEETVVEH